MSQKDIAAAIGVSPSTITRELKRNSGSCRKYNWNAAQSNAIYHKHRLAGHEKTAPWQDANEAAKTIVHLLEPFRKWIKTITTDNGSEFFRHEYITRKLDVKVYFADPHAPWQKGGIENTNGLIRQYIPKALISRM